MRNRRLRLGWSAGARVLLPLASALIASPAVAGIAVTVRSECAAEVGGALTDAPTDALTDALRGGEQVFEAAYTELCARAVSDLEAYAEWCGSVRLAADRERALNAILHFSPQHEGARRGLKHVKQRDGSWAPPPKKSEVKNNNKNLEPEGVERRRKIGTALLEGGLELARTSESDDVAQRRRWRAQVVADVLVIDTDHEAARVAGGEARREQEWVLAETVAAKAQRAALKSRVEHHVAAVPSPQATEIRPHETALGIQWAHAVATPRLRVLTDGAKAEAERAAVMCTAALEWFSELAAISSDLTPDYTIYLLVNSASRDAFVGAWPGWSDSERARVKTWAGCGVPGDIHQARWDADEAHRLDGAVRHTLGLLMLRELQFDHSRCAWAWEGFGLYLTRELVGTRYTWYSSAPASGDTETKDLLGRLMLSDVNWVNEYYQRAKRNRAPTLAKLAATRIDAFGVDDILASYAVAAYVLEGRPGALPELLGSLGASSDGGAAALARLFDDELPLGDQRILRWLSERK